MEVHFTSEQEARLSQVALRAGMNSEDLVKGAALRLLEDSASHDPPALEIPKLHLGVMTSLHRRDIYDDVWLSQASLMRTF